MKRYYKIFPFAFYLLITLLMIGSLFIPEALFSNNILNNTPLSNTFVWIFSPPVLEILLAAAAAVTIFFSFN
jgi:hypothetical protein